MIVRFIKIQNGRYTTKICYSKFVSKLFQRSFSDCKNVTPIKRYSDLLEKKILKPDQSQFATILKLQELYNNIIEYERKKKEEKLLLSCAESTETLSHETTQVPKGLYLHGGVGTGKTLLLDVFYDCLPQHQKKRVHFNTFMLYIYSEINRWNLCCDDDVAMVAPTEHIARNIMKDAWLLCFDEIQLADYASSTLLEGVFSHMISEGAVIVCTSNRSPQDLGDATITDNFDGIITKTLTSFKSLFEENCIVHHVQSDRDHRTEMPIGENRFFFPNNVENDEKLDVLFAKCINPKDKIQSSYVEIYGRKILVPISAGKVARFNYKELCNQPLGPADYVEICNRYETIFLDHIPKMGVGQKNEARRLLTLIDAVYESRVKLYCTAESAPDELFLMLPRDNDNYEHEQMHMEMLGEIAYDLKLHGMDFRSLNILSGEDEIFSFKRAISRLKEIQSSLYQNTSYRKQTFVPYVGSRAEREAAEENRRYRERIRQQKHSESQDEIDDSNIHPSFAGTGERTYTDTDWGDEASYVTLSKETINRDLKKSKRKNDGPPKFGEQHFWGFGWWEHVKSKFGSNKPGKK